MKKLIFLLLIVHCTLKIDNCLCQWVETDDPGFVNTLAVSGTNIFAGMGAPDGVSLSTNNGNNWVSVNNGLTNLAVFSLAVSGTNIFAGTYGEGVFLSTNNGTSWTAKNNGLTNQFIVDLSVSGTSIFAGALFGGVFRTTNNGTSWTAAGLSLHTIEAFAFSGTSIFAGSFGGFLSNSGVYLSTNNATSWNAAGLTNLAVYSLAVSGTNIFAGTDSSGVFRTTNNGTNWTAVNNGLTNLAVYSFAVSGTNIFAGTGGGVFLSTNNGTSWINKNQGFVVFIPAIYALLIANNYIFAGTFGQGFWRRSLAEIIGIQNISTEIPSSYSLKQNYPNPFNPVTKIEFAVPRTSDVSVSVFDVTGKEVAVLVNERLSAGTYVTDWDASTFSSGVYFYKLTTNHYLETRRMILIKERHLS